MRPNGEAGTRNHVLVVTSEPEYSHIVENVVSRVKGTRKLIPSFIDDLDSAAHQLQTEILIKLCKHPNVGKALWIGGGETCKRIEETLGKDNEQVVLFPVDNQDPQFNSRLFFHTIETVKQVSKQKRERLPLSVLKLALECGGTDYTSGLWANPGVGKVVDKWIGIGGAAVFSETAEIIGAEHLLLERTLDRNVKDELRMLIDNFETRLLKNGVNLRESNPSTENNIGGITTIEEKSLGAIAKAGSTQLIQVLQYGESITQSGLQFMDTPAFAPLSLTGMAAGGCQICAFTTGVGNPYGDTIMPTFKITAKPSTGTQKRSHVDYYITEDDQNDISEKMLQNIINIASGTLTKAEVWGDEGACMLWYEK